MLPKQLAKVGLQVLKLSLYKEIKNAVLNEEHLFCLITYLQSKIPVPL